MAAFIVAATTNASLAGDLVYTPINPSFGGSPLNSSHLLGMASAQREATAWDAGLDDEELIPTPTPGSSDADLFVRQLQARLLSQLANQVTEAIFGENGEDSGIVQFGDTSVEFDRTLSDIRLVISNATDGTVTEIVVPQLVVR
ncbi:curli production assembly protein CsgF [Devosia pacifica]|uniref:Curli production assembly/transport component CsgF n=2 Tax=Devosia pacifica TaxID=1335967 RepID=A0A918S3E1_9HYPH|nr:curli production assembly protein CsgF [Devosia pacifica]